MAIRTPAELKADILAAFSDNDSGDILPADARGFFDDAIDSLVRHMVDRRRWTGCNGTPRRACSRRCPLWTRSTSSSPQQTISRR